MKSYLYKYLIESSDKKEIKEDNYKDFTFDMLSLDDQIKYIKCFLKDFQIQGTIRKSDTRYKTFFIEVQNEDAQEFAVKQFENVSGVPHQGDNFKAGDVVFKFIYNFDVRKPLNPMGKEVDKEENGFSKFSNMLRRNTALGNRLYQKLTKHTPYSINPEF